ncbi:unnamed protein product, partial [Rotaria sordida]
MSEKLIKWSNKLIHQIEVHVDEQNKLLNEYFENEKCLLETRRKQFLTDAVSQDKKKDKEQIKRLIAECKALKFDLAKIHRYDQPISFMRIMREEQLTLEQQHDKNVHKTRENKSHRRSTEDKANSIYTSESTYQISLRELTSENTKQTNRRSTMTVTLPEIKHSTTVNKSSKLNVHSQGDSIDKCP